MNFVEKHPWLSVAIGLSVGGWIVTLLKPRAPAPPAPLPSIYGPATFLLFDGNMPIIVPKNKTFALTLPPGSQWGNIVMDAPINPQLDASLPPGSLYYQASASGSITAGWLDQVGAQRTSKIAITAV